jgi:subtilisin-like proprotein convertase family protein
MEIQRFDALAHQLGQGESRRRLLGLFGGTALGGFMATTFGPEAEAKKKKKKKKKFTLVTKSFRNGQQISLSENGNEGAPYPSLITVSGVSPARIESITVTVTSLSSSTVGLVSLLLQSPDGQTSELMWRNGLGHPASNLVLTFDDRASQPLPFNSPLVNGTYRPERNGSYPHSPPAPAQPYGSNLSLFKGGNPNGEWRLFVVENNVAGTGAIGAGWTLNITTKVKK